MGISFFTNPPSMMVTPQVFLALCVAGVAVAAPQLDFGGLRSVTTTREVATSNINQEQVVSDVVSALQPSIAQAVADALAGLQTSTFSSSLSSTSSSAAAAEAAERAAFEAEVAADAAVNTKPVYNFEYKVADKDAQTYISQSEDRDGDSLTGTYSYVNPDGALITVNYEAGPMGYTQTSSEQAGFVDIKPKPVKVATSSVSAASGSKVTSSSTGSRFSGATSVASNTGVSTTSSSSSVDQSALIAQIIAALQPQINTAVQSAISSSTATETTVSAIPLRATVPTVAVAPPRARLVPVAGPTGGIASTFGDGFSVKIDTPEFNIEY